MRMFGRCFREIFKSPLTYAAAVLFAVLCGSGASAMVKDESYTFFEIIFDRALLSQAKKSIDCSAFMVFSRFHKSAWYVIGLSVLTAIPALYIYIKSLEKIHVFSLIRSDYKTYSAGIVFSSFLSGAIITIGGILIFAAVAYLTLPSFSSFGDEILEEIYGATALTRLVRLIKPMLNHALVGGVISVFSITLYRFIRSDFLAATIPMMLMYISVKVFPNYSMWIYSEPSRAENSLVHIIALLFPSNSIDMYSLIENALNAPFWIAYIILGALLLLLYFLFYKSIRRDCL